MNKRLRLLGLAPFVAALLMDLWPGYLPALLQTPPSIFLGQPFFLVVQLALLAWAGLGLVALWQARSRWMAGLAITTTTATALVGILALPAVIAHFRSLP